MCLGTDLFPLCWEVMGPFSLETPILQYCKVLFISSSHGSLPLFFYPKHPLFEYWTHWIDSLNSFFCLCSFLFTCFFLPTLGICQLYFPTLLLRFYFCDHTFNFQELFLFLYGSFIIASYSNFMAIFLSLISLRLLMLEFFFEICIMSRNMYFLQISLSGFFIFIFVFSC